MHPTTGRVSKHGPRCHVACAVTPSMHCHAAVCFHAAHALSRCICCHDLHLSVLGVRANAHTQYTEPGHARSASGGLTLVMSGQHCLPPPCTWGRLRVGALTRYST